MAAMSKLAVAGGRPGWADLPRDLLESVLRRLPVPDRLRFPAVCTAWQFAAAAAARLPTVPSPWLMLPFNPTARRRTRSSDADAKFLEARFLSLTDGREYAIRQPAPAVSDRLCVGCSDGWLVTADAASELQLLNPVTGAQVRLLPVATLPFIDASCSADGRVVSYNLRCCFADDDDGDEVAAMIPPETLAPDMLRYEVYDKAILVSAPRRLTTMPGSWAGYAVVLICQPFRLAIAHAGDTEWTLLDTPARCWVDAVRASSAASADGTRRRAVYTMDTAGRVEEWDMDAAPPAPSRPVLPPCQCSGRACSMSAACRKYLVELVPGHLLQVHRLRDAAHAQYKWEPRPERVEYTTAEVELFESKAGGAGERSQWIRVDSKNNTASWPGAHCSWGRARRCAFRWTAAARS